MGCYYCGTTEGELRPYGPGGSPLCFPCLKSSPEIEAAAGRAYAMQLEAAEVAGGGVAHLAGEGPNPGIGQGGR